MLIRSQISRIANAVSQGIKTKSSAIPKMAPRFTQQSFKTTFQQQRNNATLMGVLGNPLVFRADSLLVKVTIAALMFYVPQDVVLFLLYLKNRFALSSEINNAQWQDDSKKQFEEWKSQRKLNNVDLSNPDSKYAYVTYNNADRQKC